MKTSDAAICRRNGWKAGDVLQGTEKFDNWSSTSRILITAIGEANILAREIWKDGKPSTASEMTWTVKHRRWRRIPPSRLRSVG